MSEVPILIPGVRVCRQNSMNILRQIVNMTGCGSSLTIFSYSVTDGWLRQLLKLKIDMDVQHITLILDKDVMVRHRSKLLQIERVADEAYLTDSHAKLYFSEGNGKAVAVITSANATNNYRNECYYGTDRPNEIEQIRLDVRTILQSSVRIDS